MILRARTILPVSQPPIENGAVVVSGNRICAVGSWPDLQSLSGGKVFDLGEVILLPGLVNAHCHLDYTDMAGKLPPPKTFTDWIALITAAKAEWSFSDYACSWLHGAHMLLRNGDHNGRRHRSCARPFAGSLELHAVARFFVS